MHTAKDLTKIDFSKIKTVRSREFDRELEIAYSELYKAMKPKGLLSRIIFKLFIKPACI